MGEWIRASRFLIRRNPREAVASYCIFDLISL